MSGWSNSFSSSRISDAFIRDARVANISSRLMIGSSQTNRWAGVDLSQYL
jgi:hypothetical protein